MAQDEMKKNPAAAEAPVEAQAEPTPVSEASPPEAGGDTARFLEEGDAAETPDAGAEAADASADDAESAADEANAADREDTAADEETQTAEAVTEAPDETPPEAAEPADETVPSEEETLPEEAAAEAADASTGGEATAETATEEDTDSDGAGAPEESADKAADLDEGAGGTDAANETAYDEETSAEDSDAGDTDADESAITESSDAEAVTEAPDETPSEAAESADETVPSEEETLPEAVAEAEAADASTGGEATAETATKEDTDSDGAGAPEESADKAADLDEGAGGTDAANETAYDEETSAEDSDAGDTDADESAITESSDAEAVTEAPDETPPEAAEAADETVPSEEEALPEEAAAEAEAADASTGAEEVTEEAADSGETTASDAEAIANDRLREQTQDLTEPETAESAAEAVPVEAAAADNAEAVAADDARTTETPAAEGRTIDLGAAETPAPAPPVKKRKKGGLIAGVAIAVLAVIYFAGAAFYHGHFFAGTTINGVAAGNRSPAAVQETVQNKAATYRLVLRGKDNHVEKVTAGALGIAYKGDAALQKLLTGQNSFAWPAMFFRKDQHAVSALRYDETKMDRVVSMLNLVTGDQVTDAQNARPVVEEDGDVRIKAAVTGNRLDKARLKTAILKAVATGDETIDLKKDRCYVEPKYQKDSPAVKRAAEVMKRYAKAKITYLFGTDSEVVDSKVFGSWLTVDGDMHVTVDEAKAADYLYQLALRTNTAYGKHTFKITGGNTITVNGGSYGWRIDREAELRQLIVDIKSSKAVNREPAYKQRGKTRKSIYEDIGNSYVEVSIAQQHMWVYKDGRQVVSTPVVTGNTLAGHGTTPGVYYIAYKARHATLKGEDYKTPVSYWMPFNGGQGIHDSWWRGAYGGTIYRGGGSHGCVNTPPGQVPAVYANVETGTPVVVYY